jgi:hypothetical protein
MRWIKGAITMPSGVQPVPRWQLWLGAIVFLAFLVVGGLLEDPKGFWENAIDSLASNIGGAAFTLLLGGLILDRWKRREVEAARQRWLARFAFVTRHIVNGFDHHLSLIAERLSDVFKLGEPGISTQYKAIHMYPTADSRTNLHRLVAKMGQQAEEFTRNHERLMPGIHYRAEPIHRDHEEISSLADQADRLYEELRPNLEAMPELVSQVAELEDDQGTIRRLLLNAAMFESAQRQWDMTRRWRRDQPPEHARDPRSVEESDALAVADMANAAKHLLEVGHEMHDLLTAPYQRAMRTMQDQLGLELGAMSRSMARQLAEGFTMAAEALRSDQQPLGATEADERRGTARPE